MSEYQYYEFRAIDRPLTKQEMTELRAISSRATITPTQFVNIYNYGDFRGKPAKLMEKYFDIFLYLANWGAHEVHLRFPRNLVPLSVVQPYCQGDEEQGGQAREVGDFVILSYVSIDESMGWVQDAEEVLPEIAPLRAEILRGDMQALYLTWLLDAQSYEPDLEAVEPPVPAGLGTLSDALQAFAAFLRIDPDLIAVAAERSAPLTETPLTAGDLERWLQSLSVAEKDAALLRLLRDGDNLLREELLLRYRQANKRVNAVSAMSAGRTLGELMDAAKQRAETRRREAAEGIARKRAKFLRQLAMREKEAWQQVTALIEAKRAAEYDQAVALLSDLREMSAKEHREEQFAAHIAELRQKYGNRPAFLERLKRAGV